MPIYYRPSPSFSAGPGGDHTPFSGSNELSHAGLSAGVESQLSSPADIGKAHQFFQPPAMDARVLGVQPMTPGADVTALTAMPGVPGAGEPISPLIQLIMKLPGHIGLLNSFFEALSNFFMPHFDLLGALDPTALTAHAQEALNSVASTASEHITINLSLIPQDAPIFQALAPGAGGAVEHSLGGIDGIGSRLGGSLGEHALRNPLQCSGQFELSKPQYELGGGPSKMSQLASGPRSEYLSGPALSGTGSNSVLSGNQRLFSDQMTSQGLNPALMSAAGSNSSQGFSLSQTVPLSGSSLPASLNVGASPFGQALDRLPAVARVQDGLLSGPGLSQNVGFHLGSPTHPSLDAGSNLGPSGAVSDHLGNQRVVAYDSLPTYRPTIGGSFDKAVAGASSAPAADTSSFSSASQPASNLTHGSDQLLSKGSSSSAAPLKELKAHQLTLKGVKVPGMPAAHAHPVMDHIAHQTSGHTTAGHAAATPGKVADQITHTPTHQTAALKPGLSKASHFDHSAHTHQQTASGGGELAKRSVEHPVDASSKPVEVAQAAKPDAAIKPAGGDAPATSQTSTYTIQPGDSLWDIARNHLGDGSRWHEIYNLNSDLIGDNPALIHPGTEIKLPGMGTEVAGSGAEASKYVVQAGDNLWDIAKDHLGGGEHWGEIYHMNSNLIGNNPGLIHPGQALSLPGSAQAEQVAATTGASSAAATTTPHLAAGSHPVTPAPTTVAPMKPAIPQDTAPVAAVNPASPPQPTFSTGPGAAEAALPFKQIALSNANKLVPASLRPDLSFLKGKFSK